MELAYATPQPIVPPADAPIPDEPIPDAPAPDVPIPDASIPGASIPGAPPPEPPAPIFADPPAAIAVADPSEPVPQPAEVAADPAPIRTAPPIDPIAITPAPGPRLAQRLRPTRPAIPHPALPRPGLQSLPTIEHAAIQALPAATIPFAAAPARPAEADAVFEGRVRDAVQAALRYPPAARMMGLLGRARVRLEYRAGALLAATIAQSAGSPLLDDAALRAVQDARYPPPRPGEEARLLRMLVWVEFRPG